jgi:dTDP-4-dehydrorhamnose reductase
MRILMVGARGMLGTDLMETISPIHDVVGVDIQEIDITSMKQCLSAAEKYRPEIIINAAAFTRVDDCEMNPEKAFLVNGDGAGNLARAAKAQGAILVHYSTDYVFDGMKKGAYLEEDVPNPPSIYGKSKLHGENQVRDYCPNHMILRTSWLFGRNGPNFIRTIIGMALQGAPLRIVADQIGSPTYSKDLAAFTMHMIEAGCLGTYHLTNSGSCTWFELAGRAVEWAGLPDTPITPVTTAEFPRPAPRPANSVLANARLRREGFSLMRPWQEAAREYTEQNLKQKS